MVLRFFSSALLLLTVTTHIGCSDAPQAVEPRILEGMAKRPALEWLDGNNNKYALASNRFGPTADARAFVDELFQLGAVQVFVADPMEEKSRLEREGGPYADTLIVELPVDKAKRAALFKVFTAEAKHEGFTPEKDVGQKQVLLWWD